MKSTTAAKVACVAEPAEDAIEELAPTVEPSFGTTRTGAQFIYNWKTSGKAGECYRRHDDDEDRSTLSRTSS